MEIGNQIKQLRLRRGITQEAMANHFGITPQAISKWERGVATPDIGMLPDISAYFGVSIDELFAISDDTRMERIQNMLWDVRFLNQADVDSTREFLLKKASREPNNGYPHALLAQMENHIAQTHRDLAAAYAKEALQRDHTIKDAHSELTEAMGGNFGDWCVYNHYALIEYYKEFVAEHPDYVPGYLWLLDQLLDDGRLEEAEYYCGLAEKVDQSYRTSLYRGLIALHKGNTAHALEILADMEARFPEQWLMYLGIGDVMVRTGNFEQAKVYYRKYLQYQKPPRYTDSLTSIAQLCEIQGDYAGAIEAIKEEIALIASDWNTTAGETVDQHYRNIARLEKKMRKYGA